MGRDPTGSAPDASADERPTVTPQIAAEAAVWVARLHGPSRSRAMERDCLAWQARSAAHRHAFERCTDTWQDVQGVTLSQAFASASASASASAPAPAAHPPTRRVFARWAVGLGVAGALMGAVWKIPPWPAEERYVTGVGEQQLVVLDDGTRLSLNTDTEVRVDLGRSRRTVHVARGEALFEVAKDPSRPFVVRASGSDVVALGTVFSVRVASGRLDVALLEGQVSVRSAEVAQSQRPAEAALAPAQPVLMRPGDRLRILAGSGAAQRAAQAQLDRPPMEQVMAWKRSEAVFDDMSLAEAVREMNRYSRTPIQLADQPDLRALRVSGVFRTGDNAAFARAVASLHGLTVVNGSGALRLEQGGAPAQPDAHGTPSR